MGFDPATEVKVEGFGGKFRLLGELLPRLLEGVQGRFALLREAGFGKVLEAVDQLGLEVGQRGLFTKEGPRSPDAVHHEVVVAQVIVRDQEENPRELVAVIRFVLAQVDELEEFWQS